MFDLFTWIRTTMPDTWQINTVSIYLEEWAVEMSRHPVWLLLRPGSLTPYYFSILTTPPPSFSKMLWLKVQSERPSKPPWREHFYITLKQRDYTWSVGTQSVSHRPQQQLTAPMRVNWGEAKNTCSHPGIREKVQLEMGEKFSYILMHSALSHSTKTS